MRYLIEHRLRFASGQPVREQYAEMRLVPGSDGTQRVVSGELEVAADGGTGSYTDYFGNRVHYAALLAPHDELEVRMRAEVETLLHNPFDYAPPAVFRERAWVDDALRGAPRLHDYVLHRSALVPDLAGFALRRREWPVHRPGRLLLESVRAAVDWLNGVFVYSEEPEQRAHGAEEMLASGEATPADFAHLLVAIVRSWGYPARYVRGYQDAGYLESRADPQLLLYAWAEVLVPGAGWRGFDVAKDLVVNDTYVAVACGRDANDAPPFRSTAKGEASQATLESAPQVTRSQQ